MAKEAADIVILDDNFSSIVKSVLWGRSVFGNIRKFLQFQLTVNGVALVLAFVAAVTSGETPLNVLQLLWVNLIMDALGALGEPTSTALCWVLLTQMPSIKRCLIGFSAMRSVMRKNHTLVHGWPEAGGTDLAARLAACILCLSASMLLGCRGSSTLEASV